MCIAPREFGFEYFDIRAKQFNCLAAFVQRKLIRKYYDKVWHFVLLCSMLFFILYYSSIHSFIHSFVLFIFHQIVAKSIDTMEGTQARTTSVRGTIREGLWEMQGIGTMRRSPLSLEKRDLYIYYDANIVVAGGIWGRHNDKVLSWWIAFFSRMQLKWKVERIKLYITI